MSFTVYEGSNQKIESCISYFEKFIFVDLADIKCWVAGGAVRAYLAGERIKDIDVFFPNEEEYKKAYDKLTNKGDKNIIFDSDNATKVYHNKKKVDLIKHYFPTPKETLSQFDFTVTCVAIYESKLHHHVDFFIDLSNKSLIINSLPYPLSTMQRLQRYIVRGYHICNGGLLDIAKAIQTLNLEEPSENTLDFYPDGSPRFRRMD